MAERGNLAPLRQQPVELVGEGLLVPSESAVEVLRFRQPLLQEVAYEGWLTHRRKILHRQIGETIERMYPHHRDEQALVSMAKQGRQQLEELFAQEREALAQRQSAGRWDQSTE